jgi:hypothetical protein
MEPLPGPVPQVGHRAAPEVEDAEGVVATVSVLGMGEEEELLVEGEVSHPGGPRVLVELERSVAWANEVHPEGAAPGEAHDGQLTTEREAGGVCGGQLGDRRPGGASLEGLHDPPTELPSSLVVQPPDPPSLPVDVGVAGPLGAVRHLAVGVALVIPSVDLPLPAGVGPVDEVVGLVQSPLGNRDAGRSKAAPPVRLHDCPSFRLLPMTLPDVRRWN